MKESEETLVIRRKQIKGEDGYKVFSIRVREETVEKLNELSARTNRSRNELIGLLLEFAIEHCSIEE